MLQLSVARWRTCHPPPFRESWETPAVYVSTVPAELIVTRGEPTYAPIPKTSLLYVTDSDNDIFMDTKSQQLLVVSHDAPSMNVGTLIGVHQIAHGYAAR